MDGPFERMLLKRRIICMKCKSTVLFFAAYSALLNCASAQSSDFVSYRDAILKNDERTIVNLIASGRNVNSSTPEGGTPLMFAIATGKTEVAEILIRNNASVTSRDNLNRTPLFLAAATGNNKIAQRVLSALSGVETIDIADNQFGFTPLHLAWNSQNSVLAQLLIDRGARVSLVDRVGLGSMQDICSRDRSSVCLIVNRNRR